MPRRKSAQVAEAAGQPIEVKEKPAAEVSKAETPAKDAREVAYINNIPKGYVQEQEGKGARVGVTTPLADDKLQEALARQAEQLKQAQANPEAGIKVDLVRQPVSTVYVNNREQQLVQSKFNENVVNVRGYELPVKGPGYGAERQVLDVNGIKDLNDQHKAAIAQHKEHLAEPNAAAQAYNKENAKNIEAAAQRAEAIAKAQQAADKAAAAPQAEQQAEAG